MDIVARPSITASCVLLLLGIVLTLLAGRRETDRVWRAAFLATAAAAACAMVYLLLA